MSSELYDNEDYLRCPRTMSVVGGCDEYGDKLCTDCKDYNECQDSWRCEGHVRDVGIDYPMMFCLICSASIDSSEIDYDDPNWNTWELSSKEDKS